MPAQRTVDICLIEAKATGDPLIRDLRLGGVSARGYTPKGDKNARVQRAAPLIECGLVYLPTEEKNPERITPKFGGCSLSLSLSGMIMGNKPNFMLIDDS